MRSRGVALRRWMKARMGSGEMYVCNAFEVVFVVPVEER